METKMTVRALITKWGTRSIGVLVRSCAEGDPHLHPDVRAMIYEMMEDLDTALTDYYRQYPED